MKKLKWFFVIILFLNGINILNPLNSPKAIINREPWEDQGLVWYYDNLDDNDRRKIRQAMDYAIPRQAIIDELHNGLAVPLATEIGQNVMGYDDSVQPRLYNLTKSKELLKEVFGKIYNQDLNVSNSKETNIPYFSMKLVSPTTCVARTQWTMIITESFRNIGIVVESEWWNWNIFMPRIYLDPKGIGYDYNHGGVDAWFVGMNSKPDPDYSTEYFLSGFPPKGDNAFWIENEKITEIINRSLIETNLKDRLRALSEYQHWFYNEVPKSIIRQGLDVFAVDNDLEGFDTFLVGRGWCFNNWTVGNQNSLTYTVPGDLIDFNPLLSYNYYDFVPLRNVFGSLAQRRGGYNLTHSVPQIADSWTQTADGLTWEVKLKADVKWSDGTKLTANDVLFSYHIVFEDNFYPSLNHNRLFTKYFPNNQSNIYLKAGTTDTIVFQLGTFFPYVESQIFTLPILQKAQWENIPYSDWKTHPLNTGTGTEYIKGCGPYMMTNYNISTGMVLEINPFFDQDVFGHDPDANGGGIFFTNPTLEEIRVVVIKEATTAIAGLASGIYDAIDSQTGLQSQYKDLNAPNNEYHSKCITVLEYGWQELCYNHYDPRWGMNAHDPRDMYPDEYTRNKSFSFLNFLSISLVLVFLVLIRFKNDKN